MTDEFHPGEERTAQPRRKWPRVPFGYLLAGLIASLVSIAIYAGAQYFYQASNSRRSGGALDNPLVAEEKSQTSNVAGSGLSELRKTSESFRLIAKKVGPAVVNIKSTKGIRPKTQSPGQPKGKRGRRPPQPDEEEQSPFRGGDPLLEFFERFGQPFPFHPFPQETPQTSLGSGIIIDKKGTVVTNNHVVEDATEILVTLSGEKTDLKAKVVGTDPRSDLAVLKIEKGGDFPFAEWADSEAVEVGDWAIAIGSPFALGQSVTVGIVSAKGRNAQGLGPDFGGELLQTDAAINPGNSGGPLVDLEGRVMGVNTAIYTRSGGYMGIGFAIPSNLAKDVVGKLITDGKIVRGWLGVYIQPLDSELAKELKVKDGVSIHEVIQDSPAAKSGLNAGDVIVEVEGKSVKEVSQLQRVISGFKPNQTVEMKVMSYTDKKTRTVKVKIGTLPEKEGPSTKEEKGDEPDKLGLVVSPKGKEGVVVDMIQPGSVADQIGLEIGDVIVRINRNPVDSTASYKKLVDSAKRLYLEVKRKGRTLFYQFTLPE